MEKENLDPKNEEGRDIPGSRNLEDHGIEISNLEEPICEAGAKFAWTDVGDKVGKNIN